MVATDKMMPNRPMKREPKTAAIRIITPIVKRVAATEMLSRTAMSRVMAWLDRVETVAEMMAPRLVFMGIWPLIQAKLLLQSTIKPAAISSNRRPARIPLL